MKIEELKLTEQEIRSCLSHYWTGPSETMDEAKNNGVPIYVALGPTIWAVIEAQLEKVSHLVF